jgi:hypothetical protein
MPVPVPVTTSIPLFTNGAGQSNLAWASWPPVLSGSTLDFQYAIADAAAVCGVAPASHPCRWTPDFAVH